MPNRQILGNDLYRYEVGSGAADARPHSRRLQKRTRRNGTTNGARVLGVVGASEDGSYVYFVAEGHLRKELWAVDPNLYVWHEPGRRREQRCEFIATLAAPEEGRTREHRSDGPGTAFHYHSDVEDWTSWPSGSQAYVTPNGTHLAFMSVNPSPATRAPTKPGNAVHEVFEYSAKPASSYARRATRAARRRLAAPSSARGWTNGRALPFHQPRSSERRRHRLFFSSPDALVPGVDGGSLKLFEYEDGTIQLISGAEAGREAVFLDASASGNDVFFATRERLAPTDTDELIDVYDARVDGGLPTLSQPASCEGAVARNRQLRRHCSPHRYRPLSAGAGNLIPSPSKPPVKLDAQAAPVPRAGDVPEAEGRSKRRSVCVALAMRRYGQRPRDGVGRPRRGDLGSHVRQLSRAARAQCCSVPCEARAVARRHCSSSALSERPHRWPRPRARIGASFPSRSRRTSRPVARPTPMCSSFATMGCMATTPGSNVTITDRLPEGVTTTTVIAKGEGANEAPAPDLQTGLFRVHRARNSSPALRRRPQRRPGPGRIDDRGHDHRRRSSEARTRARSMRTRRPSRVAARRARPLAEVTPIDDEPAPFGPLFLRHRYR